MNIVRLPVGKQAPVDADCIRIEQSSNEAFTLTASALCTDAEDSDSVTLVDGPAFQTPEQAEAAGLVWAESVGVEQLFVSTGTLERPLETIEIDKPL